MEIPKGMENNDYIRRKHREWDSYNLHSKLIFLSYKLPEH